jgi:hypothetical protein
MIIKKFVCFFAAPGLTKEVLNREGSFPQGRFFLYNEDSSIAKYAKGY